MPVQLPDLEAIASASGVDPLELLDLADFVQKEGGVQGQSSGGSGLYVPRSGLRCIEWMEENYYTLDGQGESIQLIRLEPHQKVLLWLFFQHHFATRVWSTIKKSGKTTIAAAVARWVNEEWGPFAEILMVANDYEQSKSRLFGAVQRSIEQTPGYDLPHRELRGESGETIWKITEKQLLHYLTGGAIKSVSADYAGEAGSNPNASFYSELWGFIKEKSRKLWDELTPVATRVGSFRWVETYAGFTNERGPLWDLYQLALKFGRQLTCHDLEDCPFEWPGLDNECNCGTLFGCCPAHNAPPLRLENPNDSGGLPIYINEQANLIAYWDRGVRARRMPWQRGDVGDRYYSQQAATERPNAYSRLHENAWTESHDAFIQIEWWDANEDAILRDLLKEHPDTLGITDLKQEVILSADGAVSGDCCGLTMHTRYPSPKLIAPFLGVPVESLPDLTMQAALRAAWVWYPPVGGKFNYQDTIEKKIRELCGCYYHEAFNPTHSKCQHHKRFNVVCITYDEFQLHDVMQRLRRDALAWCFQFGQMAPRLTADKDLHATIQGRRCPHPGAPALGQGQSDVTEGLTELREHLINADAKTMVDEDRKLRIVKREKELKIDLAVCVSMGQNQTLKLNI